MSQSGQYASFGSGILIAKTSAGQAVPFGALQDVQFEIAGKNERLRGQYQSPLAVARAETDYTFKAKNGYICGPVYSELFFGATASVGTNHLAYNESGTIPSATAYTVTVANSAKFVSDWGVTYASNGAALEMVTGTPQTGQYSVSAGVYTFAAADAGLAVNISYLYSDATNGSTIVVPNQLQGVQPVFSVILQRSYNGTGERYLASNCIASKLSVPTQMAKFAISEFDFEAFSPNGQSPLSIYTDT